MPTGIYKHHSLSKKTKRKISEANKGKEHWNWMGGISKTSDYMKVAGKKYYLKHKDKVDQYRKEWHKKNKIKVSEHQKLWYANLPPEKKEHYLEVKRQYRKNHLEYFRNYMKMIRKINPKYQENSNTRTINYRAKKRGNDGHHTTEEWEYIKSIKYNNTCQWCFKKEPEIKLTRDHITPISLGGNNNIENIQPLCRSCNSSKSNKLMETQLCA